MERIKSVKLTKKQYEIFDYKTATEKCVNLTVDKDGLYQGYGVVQTEYSVPIEQVRALYRIGGRSFVYCEDGYLYDCVDGEITNGHNVGSIYPAVVELLCDGEKKILFAGELDKGVLIGASNRFNASFPQTKCMIVHNDRLFAANENAVRFYHPFDFTRSTMPFSGGGTINVPTLSGGVLGFYSENKKLYIICKHSIYRLTAFGEGIDFTLEKVNTPYLNVAENTIKAVYDVCLFISDGKLMTFSEEKLTEKKSLLDKLTDIKVFPSASSQGAYLLPIITSDDSKLIYAYEVVDQSESFISTDCAAVSDGGYIPSASGVVRLDLMGETIDGGIWKSKFLTLNTMNGKSLLSVSAFVGAKCVMTIEGESGKKKFTLKKGCNVRKLNLWSRSFSITIQPKEQGFCLSDLRLIYTIRGE